MIILITGASHTGKTLLAQKMLEKYGYPYLSLDHLKMGLIRSGNTDLTPEDDDALTEYLWPIVREIVKTAIENRQDLIIEGCYIPFDWRRDLDERYLPSVRFICLAMTESYIENHFDDIIGYESAIESRLAAADCTIDGLKEDNRRCIEGFRRAGERVVLIDSDYERAVNALLTDDRSAYETPLKTESAAERHDMKISYLKLEIFIPETHLGALQTALHGADAGHIGSYDCCLSYSPVTGTWRPLPGTAPYIGEEGSVSCEQELKVEVTIRAERLDETLQAIRAVHPYEEPVVNAIPLWGTGMDMPTGN